MFLEVIDPFVTEIWSFITFHRGFFYYNFKINETTGFIFPGLFFHTPINVVVKFLVY